MTQPTKVCNTCKTEKPLSEFYRYRAKNRESRHYAACKVCQNERIAKKSNAPKFQRDPNAERWTKPQAPYQPLNVQRDIGPGVSAARPGAFDHEKYGSRLPDGSIQPYRKPRCEPSYCQPQALQPRLNNGKFSNG